MAVIGNSLIKSHNSETVMHTDIKTVIVLTNFSFGFNHFSNLSSTFFIKLSLTVFIFSQKTRFYCFFLGSTLFTSMDLWPLFAIQMDSPRATDLLFLMGPTDE